MRALPWLALLILATGCRQSAPAIDDTGDVDKAPGAPVTADIEKTDPRDPMGRLIVHVNGGSQFVADDVTAYWATGSTPWIYFSAINQLPGGQESNSTRLLRWKAGMTEPEPIAEDRWWITDLQIEEGLEGGKTALIVQSYDGLDGPPSLSVIDPDRGRVLYLKGGKMIQLKDDALEVGIFDEAAYRKAAKDQMEDSLQPLESKTFSLSELLKRDGRRGIPTAAEEAAGENLPLKD